MNLNKNFNFLLQVAKSGAKDRKKLIKGATSEELDSLADCLSLRSSVSIPPTPKVKKLVSELRESKDIRSFLLSHHRSLKSIIICVLSRFIFEACICVCDTA